MSDRKPTEWEAAFAFSSSCSWGTDPRLDWVREWIEKNGWPKEGA